MDARFAAGKKNKTSAEEIKERKIINKKKIEETIQLFSTENLRNFRRKKKFTRAVNTQTSNEENFVKN